MSIDFETIATREELIANPFSKVLEYMLYWQKLLEQGVELEWWSSMNKRWKPEIHAEIDLFEIYRRKPQPTKKMVPLDFSDYLDIERKWLIDTRTNEKCFISDFKNKYDLLIKGLDRSYWTTFESLQKYFTRLDGSKFEKEVTV